MKISYLCPNTDLHPAVLGRATYPCPRALDDRDIGASPVAAAADTEVAGVAD